MRLDDHIAMRGSVGLCFVGVVVDIACHQLVDLRLAVMVRMRCGMAVLIYI